MQVHVLLAQGFGNDEDAFEVVGVFNSVESMNRKKADIIGEQHDFDPVFRSEEHEVE